MRTRWPLLAAQAVAFGLASSAASARADACPDTLPELAGIDPEVRLRFLSDTFHREIRDVDIWSWTWGSIYAAAAVAQAAILPVESNSGTRTGLAVGAISAGAGSVFLYVLPLQITLPLRSTSAAWNDPDRCHLLARAETTLVDGARHQAFSNGIVPHIGNVLVNAGIALILGLGYHQWTSAAISAGVGLAIGETNAFTQPHHLPSALARYRSGAFAAAPQGVTWWVSPSAPSAALGVSAGVTF